MTGSVSAHRMVKSAIDAFIEKGRLEYHGKMPPAVVYARMVDGAEMSGELEEYHGQAGYLVVKRIFKGKILKEVIYINVDYIMVFVIEPLNT